MPVPFGSWEIKINDAQGELVIRAVDHEGRLSGTAFGDPIQGSWDELTGKVTFLRVRDSAEGSSMETYTGYLVLSHEAGGEKTVLETLAGVVRVFSGQTILSSLQRPAESGWVAQKLATPRGSFLTADTAARYR